MITKIEIEDALAAQVESAAKVQGISTGEFIRAALRQALSVPAKPVARACFAQRVHDFGTHIESPWTILVDIESEEYVLKYNRK